MKLKISFTFLKICKLLCCELVPIPFCLLCHAAQQKTAVSSWTMHFNLMPLFSLSFISHFFGFHDDASQKLHNKDETPDTRKLATPEEGSKETAMRGNHPPLQRAEIVLPQSFSSVQSSINYRSSQWNIVFANIYCRIHACKQVKIRLIRHALNVITFSEIEEILLYTSNFPMSLEVLD